MKRKIPTFIFGVSIGLFVGVAFFVFKFNDLFDRLRASATEKITVIQQPIKNVPQENESARKDHERFKLNFDKHKKTNYKEVDSLIAQDSKINIATDELVSVKNVKVIKIGDGAGEQDTLAAKLAHVDESENNSDLYFIEFWKTPLNSKGYRFSKNKIMLYGFVDFNNVLLYQLDTSYYIKCSDQVYRLFYGGEFKQLERVIDSNLLAKIN
ncbi:MAG: hypothetical protein PSX36_13335 [bacterium]|nr:hypothetical protein [bacterium]